MTSSIAARLQLSYRDDLRLLVGRWLTADATLAEFQAEYAAVLVAAQAHGAWRWLLDTRRRPLPPAGAAEWLHTVFIPEAGAAAPHRLCMAYLLSPQRLQTIAADERLQAAVTRLTVLQARFEVRMFHSEGEATRWLTDKQVP